MFLRAAASWRSFLLFLFWTTGLAGVFAWLSVVFIDSEAATYFRPQFGGPLHVWASRITDVGKADPYFALAGSAWVALLLLARLKRSTTAAERLARWRNRAWNVLLAFAVSGLLVQAIKHSIGRKRPYADLELSAVQFEPMTAFYEFHSFPSGHSQVLFTAATILCVLIPRGAPAWLTLAGGLALTRVVTLNHWMSDVVAGAAVGMLGTVLVLRLLAATRVGWVKEQEWDGLK